MKVTRQEYKEIKALFNFYRNITLMEAQKVLDFEGMIVRSVTTLWKIRKSSNFKWYKISYLV